MKFEWDARKATSNLQKHGVAFADAVTVFADPFARIHDDPDHSAQENREIIVGRSARGDLLLVFFTERGEAVRLFSARRPTKLERHDYEEGII